MYLFLLALHLQSSIEFFFTISGDGVSAYRVTFERIRVNSARSRVNSARIRVTFARNPGYACGIRIIGQNFLSPSYPGTRILAQRVRIIYVGYLTSD